MAVEMYRGIVTFVVLYPPRYAAKYGQLIAEWTRTNYP